MLSSQVSEGHSVGFEFPEFTCQWVTYFLRKFFKRVLSPEEE